MGIDPKARIGHTIETAVGGEKVRAYVPPPLPPHPPIQLDTLLDRLSRADRALGRLDGITTLLPDKSLFLYMYVRKEAVLSSQIEGIPAPNETRSFGPRRTTEFLSVSFTLVPVARMDTAI